jgi:GMP synthase-like glutamine amidotransferase
VIENDPTDDARLLGEWLTEAGLSLHVVRAHAGEALPASLDGYAAFVVLGGDQHAYATPSGEPGAAWFPALEGLLRKAVRDGVPTLGVCLGAQLLATAHAGTVAHAAAGPEIGAGLVAKRDAAEADPLFGLVPMLPDVVQWHHDEITELPLGAVLLAASPDYSCQAFRLGSAAWGLQFHIECDAAMIADWASTSEEVLAALGTSADAVVARVAALSDDLFEVWQPFATRFAVLAQGAPVVAPDLVVPPGARQLPLAGR